VEVIVFMFQFLVGFLGIVGFIMAVMALSKASKSESDQREHREQVFWWQARAEKRIAQLEEKLETLVESGVVKPARPPQKEPESEKTEATPLKPAASTDLKPRVKMPKPPPLPTTPKPAGPAGVRTEPPKIPIAAKLGVPSSAHQAPKPLSGQGPKLPAFDLEKWLGVRGAAVLGGIVLALAGIYLFKYAIDQGLISPIVRVALGGVAGIGCLFTSKYLRGRNFDLPANAVAGGGVVILYGTIWASHGLYHLIHGLIAFFFMAVVTVICGFLANAYRSRTIGMLGLFGGFAAPIMIYSGELPALGLFAYLLLLNLGLLYLAKKMEMPSMGFISLLATAFYQAFVILTQLEDTGMILIQVILVVFAGVYILWCEWFAPDDSRWAETRTGGMLVPFIFGMYLASNDIVVLDLVPMGVMLAILSLGACWLAYKREDLGLMGGAAGGSVAVLWFWMFNHVTLAGCIWLKALIPVGIAAIFCLPFVLGQRGGKSEGLLKRFHLIGWLVVLAVFSWTLFASLLTSPVTLLPWLLGWLVLSGLLVLLGLEDRFARLNELIGIILGLGLGSFLVFLYDDKGFSWPVFLVAMAVVAIGLTAIHRVFRGEKARNDADQGVAAFPIVMLVAFTVPFNLPMGVGGTLILTLFLAFLGAFVAARNANGMIYIAVIFATMVCQWSQITYGGKDEIGWLPLAGPFLTAAFFSFFPFFTKLPFKNRKWVWYGSAFAPVVWFPSLYITYHRMFGNDNVALLALALGAMSLGAALLCQQGDEEDVRVRKTGLIWFAAVALGFVTMAIPLELKKAWLTVSWSLEALALLGLWYKWKHPGLKYTATGLFAVVVARLVLNPFVLEYAPDDSGRIFNWLMYTYLIPVACMLVGCKVLRGWEQKLAHAKEAFLYRINQPVFSYALGFATIVVVFVYLNLAVFQFYNTGGSLEITLVRHPARDLTLSLVWAAYGLSLMVLGIRGRFTAVRRLSLSLIILTLSKVFLYDLGELTDLYRVAFLFGLAVSLLAISIIYQKYVTFENRDDEPSSGQVAGSPSDEEPPSPPASS